jgi:beta-galactosidase/beta-glucuronidase
MTRPVNVTVHTSAANATSNVLVTVHDNGKVLKTHSGPSNRPFQFNVESPELWSPDSPKLYNVTVKLGNDKVQSYTGFRTIEKGKVNGVVRPMLNGEFVFMFGTLDQGFWPDGIYTPPTKEAMVYDLKVLKSLGFNMVRKHVSGDNSFLFFFFFFFFFFLFIKCGFKYESS